MKRINFYTKNIAMKFMLVVISGVIFSSQVNAVQRQDVKCYVELYGGGETVIFIETYGDQAKHLNHIAKQWLNKKVMTQIAKEKKVIYKVHECALLNIPFKTSKARAVDDNTGR